MGYKLVEWPQDTLLDQHAREHIARLEQFLKYGRKLLYGLEQQTPTPPSGETSSEDFFDLKFTNKDSVLLHHGMREVGKNRKEMNNQGIEHPDYILMTDEYQF